MRLKLFFLLLIFGGISGELRSQEMAEIKLVDSISVSFDSGSSLIRNPSKLISRLNQTKLSHGKIELIAYTDSIGNGSYNKSLASKRLRAVSQLIDSTDVKDFICDTINLNEGRKEKRFDDDAYRRVDILLYSVVPKIRFGIPFDLKINFNPQTVNIIKQSIKNVQILQMMMEIDTTFQIKLNGHVCCGPDLILSLHRAEKVKAYLVNHGINANRISCNGYSNTVKLVPETSEKNKEMNRRVEVVFVK